MMPNNVHTVLAIVALIIPIVVNTIFGAVVLTRTYRKLYGWFFALTMLGVIGWAIGDLTLLFARDPHLLHWGAELFYISPMLVPVFIWFFALSFPGNTRIGWLPQVVVAVSFSALAAIFIFDLPLFISSINIVKSGMNSATLHLPYYLFYASFFSLFFSVTYVAFLLKIQRLKGVSKTQARYTFYGALGASIPALITNLALPIMLGNGHWIWLGPLFTLFFTIAVTTSIVRHKLFDIQPVIMRSLGYTITTLVVAILYGFIVFTIAQYVFNIHFSVVAQVLLSVSTGLMSLPFIKIKKTVDRATNRLFYRDAYDTAELLDAFNKEVVATVELNELLRSTTSVLAKYLKVSFCIAGVKDRSEVGFRMIGTEPRQFSLQEIAKLRTITPKIHRTVIVTDNLNVDDGVLHYLLAKNDIAVLARLTTNVRAKEEGLGYIVLGPKKSGNPYTTQDVKAIETVANELIIAVQNALRFEEIEQFNVTLQRRVTEATQHLKETNAKLKKLDETKDDFISMASHQLRTPLTSVKGYLSLVLEGDAGKITATQRKLLGQAFISSQRMVFLISDLLNVSRLKTGKFVIEPSAVNLADMVAEEIGQLLETVESRGLTVEYKKPEQFPDMQLDETKTRQVIMNFIDNAIYYTPEGGHIAINLLAKEKSIELRVSDNGIGVPKAEQHHLFTKFFRAKNAQTARPDGTGLGLFMAKKVIVAQGGALIFQSTEGKGSVFGFIFPLT